MLSGGGLQVVLFDAVAEDGRHPALCHLPVGLIVEFGHAARHALEGDDRSRLRMGDTAGHCLQRERLLGDADVDVDAAADRRDQGELVVRTQAGVRARVLAVDRHRNREAVEGSNHDPWLL